MQSRRRSMSPSAELLDYDASWKHEQVQALHRLLPRSLQFKIGDFIPLEHQERIHTHLSSLFRTITTLTPNWLSVALGNDLPLYRYHDQVTLLFADVTKFTPITEHLNRKGADGLEFLTDLLNRFFDT